MKTPMGLVVVLVAAIILTIAGVLVTGGFIRSLR
jgi:hypothetical protein